MSGRIRWPSYQRNSRTRKLSDGRASMGENPRSNREAERAWLVSKVRSDIAMMATKLNAQVIIKNLKNMHEKSLPPTGARRRMELEYQDCQDWARLQLLEGRGPRTGGPFDLTIGWRSW